ncbi:4F2 cell-surface antigen heavy chain-like isoform X2 [Gouania willdenowi]|uniref:4F2 cell-surface antigen heavy chain-like isoform X2 n=1 Tax=Gouania willdenowi TaxID=441366 RepID=UPI001056C185|nr:4F2 cell-surface antigen heavy chain-like isoform X2 [Gouania willdenowi]
MLIKMEDTNVDAPTVREDAAAPPPGDAEPLTGDSELNLGDTEAAVGNVGDEAELDEEQQEKEPMTGASEWASEASPPAAGGETNGSVKLKMEDEEVKFTGLSKEELLRVAGTPGWVRTRWTLLVLFWLSWLLMLVGSVLIILKAPPCRDLPDSHWWNHGPLYRLRDVRVFSDMQDLRGVERRMDYLKQLNVKGLLIGPIHEAPPNNALSLRFEQISSDLGTMNQFKSLISTAHKKGISVVLDLTPNYQGSTGPWFSNDSITIVAEKLKGVEGFLFSGTDLVSNSVPSLWTDIRNIIQNGTESRPGRRVLMGLSEFSSVDHVSSLLSSSGVDLLLSPLLSSGSGGFAGPAEVLDSVQTLCASHSQLNLAWSLGGAEVHLASAVGPALVRLYQLLLLTLPGTPVFNYGDEVGLMDQGTEPPQMLWDPETETDLNGTLQVEWAERRSSLSFFRSVATLRVKERPLLFGDFLPLSNSSSLLSYVRVWDRGARYLVAFNWGSEEAELVQAGRAELPQQAEVVASTDTSLSDGEVELGALRIGPQQATLLRFNIK